MQEEKFVDFTVDQAFLDQNPEVAADLKIGDVIQVPEIEDVPVPTPDVVTPPEPVVPVVETPEVAPATDTLVAPKIHAGKVIMSFDGTHATLESYERVPMTQEEYDALP